MDWTTWFGAVTGATGILVWNLLRDTVFCSLKLAICWYTTSLVNWVYTPVEVLLDQMPDMPDAVTEVGEVAFCINHWVPLFEMFGFEILLFSIWTSWVVIRLVKSFVPTLAN